MKKFGVILSILTLIALLGGCASGPELTKMDILTVDLSALPYTKNTAPLTRQWADVIFDFEGVLPDDIDWGNFNRLIVKINYFDANNRLIAHDNDLAMLTLVYDLSQLENPVLGRGADPGINIGNAAQKQFNLMGEWSNVHTRGCMIALLRKPGALVLQNSNARVAFIEVTEITFYNDDVISFEDSF